ATATHGTAEVPAAKAPPHASAEVAATHRAAEVSAAHAPAPMTGCVATGRNGVGRDDGTSQCHGNNDDRDSMQRGFPRDGYLRSKGLHDLAPRSAPAKSSDGENRMYLPPLTSVCSILRPLSPACRNRNCAGRTDVSRWYARTRPRLHPRGRLRRFAGASQLPSMAQPQTAGGPPMLITPTINSAHTDRKKR